MKTKSEHNHFICIFIIALFLLPTFVDAEEQEIRVVTGNASIRLKPDTESEIIETPPIGTVFGVENKVGEWYEIKFRSRVGMIIIGYIHEKDVEEMKIEEEAIEEIKPEPEKVAEVRSSPPRPIDRKKMIHIKVGGLSSFGKVYDHEHSIPLFEERLIITNIYETSPAFGVNLGAGVFINTAFEVTANIDLFFSQTDPGKLRIDVPNPNIFYDHKSDESKTDLSPRKTRIGFGINFHPIMDGMIRPYIGAGGNYIHSKIDLVTGFSWTLTEYQDGRHSVELTNFKYEETSFSKFGFNLGAGINLEVTDNMVIFGEGNYAIAKADIMYPLYESDRLEVNLGGFVFYTGVKFLF